jgi:hypothetical protein
MTADQITEPRCGRPTSFLYHAPGTDTAGHVCAERVFAICRRCHVRVVICLATDEVIRRIVRRQFRCDACEGVASCQA